MPATLNLPGTTVDELRSATRIGVRTPIVVYNYDAEGKLVRSRAWTDDLSLTGARITSEQPLQGDKYFVRLMLPELKDQIIACEIVREIPIARETIGNMFDIRRSYYGIRFIGLATEEVVRQIEQLDNVALGR